MRLTLFADYGLRALIYLALNPDRLASIAEIAAAYKISENHLIKVVHRLGQAGFAETIRGRNGGLRLARDAGKIGLGEVVRAMEVDVELVNCRDCAIQGPCRMGTIFDEALAAMLGVLDRYTLADVANPEDSTLRRRLSI